MKTKKELMTESYGYATLSSELHMNHWNEKLSQIEGLGFDAPAPDKSQPMAHSESLGLRLMSVNECVARLMGPGSIMEEFAPEDDEAEDEETVEESDEDETETSDDDLWLECSAPLKK